MSLYEVRRGQEIERVDDVAQLRTLARSGQLGRGDELRVDGGAWTRADALPELDGAFDVDIWDAWEDLDEVVPPPAPGAAPLPPELGESDEPTDEAPPAPLPPELVQPLVAPEPARPPGRVVAMRPRRARQATLGRGPSEEDELPEVEVEPLAEAPAPTMQPMGEVIAFPGAPTPLPPPRRPAAPTRSPERASAPTLPVRPPRGPAEA
ncbi:MAG: hypothetical protein H6741_13310, partial [Alphaproteobacteria bacterium]|nr:hypothetical protein [Alphaproteobacteria bacterium]